MERTKGSELPRQFHTLSIFPELLPLIESGQKTLDVRVAYPQILRVKIEDIIRFNGNPQYARKVTRIGAYGNFDEMYDQEDFRLIHPTVPLNQQLAFLHRIYPPDKEQLGVRVFELDVI